MPSGVGVVVPAAPVAMEDVHEVWTAVGAAAAAVEQHMRNCAPG